LSVLFLFTPLTTLAQEMCEGNFDCDADVDSSDAATFKQHFGRSNMLNPCTNVLPCSGDFDCDKDVDSSDAAKFEQDFGRSTMLKPCTACVPEAWCDYPATSSTTTTCAIQIVYGRPGRRGIPLTCNDIVDFTLCSDCSTYDPSCLVWTITPAAPWLSIVPIDDVTWRLIIGNACQDPDKADSYAITATDTCNNASDTVVIEVL